MLALAAVPYYLDSATFLQLNEQSDSINRSKYLMSKFSRNLTMPAGSSTGTYPAARKAMMICKCPIYGPTVVDRV